MSRCFIRLVVVLVAALAATLTPLSTSAAMDISRGDCCEHATHAAPHCSDCIVCATGLSCVLPAAMPAVSEAGIGIVRFARQDFTAETRTDPPPLPPPRASA